MLDKDAFDIDSYQLYNLKTFQNKTCVKDPSVVTQKNKKIMTSSDTFTFGS